MDSFKTRGIVTRRADYGEANCMLTVLSEDFGAISVCVYGVKSKKSKLRAGAQLLTYADFVLNKKGGEIFRAESIEVIDGFCPVSSDLEKLALANYLCELAADTYADGDTRILRLLLNTLYALSYRNVSAPLSKAVFELKLMQYSGYEPQLDTCIKCGGEEGLWQFDFSGGILCENCLSNNAVKISAPVLEALRYIIAAEDNRIFSFRINDDACKELAEITEGYLLNKNERSYKSLEYLKKIL